jgi:hypothetical protein
MTNDPHKLIKSSYIGEGWTAHYFGDESMLFRNSNGTSLQLPPNSTRTLIGIFDDIEKGV